MKENERAWSYIGSEKEGWNRFTRLDIKLVHDLKFNKIVNYLHLDKTKIFKLTCTYIECEPLINNRCESYQGTSLGESIQQYSKMTLKGQVVLPLPYYEVSDILFL